MRTCELCNSPARLFCESDEASLCWECDAKVHSANFIVTKHPRFLLCHACHSLTVWHASGPSFLPTFSLCHHCLAIPHPNPNHDDTQDQDMDGADEDEDEDDDDDDDEEEENQVVPPWTCTPPPSASSSSNISECSDIHTEEGVSD